MVSVIELNDKVPRITRGNDFVLGVHLVENRVVGYRRIEQREIEGEVTISEVKLVAADKRRTILSEGEAVNGSNTWHLNSGNNVIINFYDKLPIGRYGIEIIFTVGGLDKRFYLEPGTCFNVVESSPDGFVPAENVMTYQADANTGLGTLVDMSDYYTKGQMNDALQKVEQSVGYFECSTAGGTAAKTVTAPSYALRIGGSLHIKMTNGNTASNPTLNINATGAKPIYYNGTIASPTNSWEAGEVIEVYYDGTNYQATNFQGGGGKAEKIKYDNTQSGMEATNAQAAIDELKAELTELAVGGGEAGDGVYDISAAYPNASPFVSLPAALTAFTDISKKKGGMTVKYIGTDGKYYQYRYLLANTDDEYFEDKDNWEAYGNSNNDSNISISVVDNALVISVLDPYSPQVSIGGIAKDVLSARIGHSDTSGFIIGGKNLVNNIFIELSDTTNFSINNSTLTPSNGNVPSTQIIITYNPTTGNVGTIHPCNISIFNGATLCGEFDIQGVIADVPSISLSPASVAISAASGEIGTKTIHVSGTDLEGDVLLTITGDSNISFDGNSSSKVVSRQQALEGVDVVVTFDGSAGASATITASSSDAENVTVSVTGTIVARKEEGQTFNVGNLKYTVLSNTNNVSVSMISTSATVGNVTVPSTVQDENGISYNVTAIAANAFKPSSGNNATLTGITLPNTIISIGQAAFQNCTALTSLDIPNSVTSLGAICVYNCPSLANVTIGSGVTSIPKGFYTQCGSNKTLIIPDTVTSMAEESGAYTFLSTSFVHLEFGSGISFIRGRACIVEDGKVVIRKTGSSVNKTGYPFSYNSSGSTYSDYKCRGKLYVPSALVNEYKSKAGWGIADANGYAMFPDEGQILPLENLEQ